MIDVVEGAVAVQRLQQQFVPVRMLLQLVRHRIGIGQRGLGLLLVPG